MAPTVHLNLLDAMGGDRAAWSLGLRIQMLLCHKIVIFPSCSLCLQTLGDLQELSICFVLVFYKNTGTEKWCEQPSMSGRSGSWFCMVKIVLTWKHEIRHETLEQTFCGIYLRNTVYFKPGPCKKKKKKRELVATIQSLPPVCFKAVKEKK